MADGQMDENRNAPLIDIAKTVSITFHRTFDMCPDPIKVANFVKILKAI